MKILHVSDTHYGQSQAAMRNAPVVTALLDRDDLSECVVVHTGDLMETPTHAEMRTAVGAWRPVARACRAFVLCRGNHDTAAKGIFRFTPSTHHWGLAVDGLRAQIAPIDVGPWRIIPADTCQLPPGWRARLDPRKALAQGYLGPEQREIIASHVAVARAVERIPVLAMHHCPTGGNPALRLIDRQELAFALQAVGGVDVMLTGHLHRKGEWSGVLGAGIILSAPKCSAEPGWWELEVVGREVRHRWVGVSPG